MSLLDLLPPDPNPFIVVKWARGVSPGEEILLPDGIWKGPVWGRVTSVRHDVARDRVEFGIEEVCGRTAFGTTAAHMLYVRVPAEYTGIGERRDELPAWTFPGGKSVRRAVS